VSEDALIALVEYIKGLNSNYRIQQTLTSGEQASATQMPAAPSGMVKQ
jgi:cytochrome c oxidase subunit 2